MVLEIYFQDLTKEAQERFRRFWGKDANIEEGIFPIAVLETEKETETNRMKINTQRNRNIKKKLA